MFRPQQQVFNNLDREFIMFVHVFHFCLGTYLAYINDLVAPDHLLNLQEYANLITLKNDFLNSLFVYAYKNGLSVELL